MTDYSVTVHQRLRPLRFAFLVRPDDRAALRGSIEACTILWGGRFNAIIPVGPRRLRRWSDRPPVREIGAGMLAAFDPDYIVQTAGGLAARLGAPKQKIVAISDILSRGAKSAGYGLGADDLYESLYRREFRFLQRRQPQVCIPQSLDPQQALFLSACCGAFPERRSLGHFRRAYIDLLGAQTVTVTANNYLDTANGFASPLRIGSAELDVLPRGSPGRLTFLYIDGTNPLDLIDFWNLRAIGWTVIPIPYQWGDECIRPAERLWRLWNEPSIGMPLHSPVICSVPSLYQRAEAFASAIQRSAKQKMAPQHWYPRMWDAAGRKYDHAFRCEVSAATETSDCRVERDGITIPLLDPNFGELERGRPVPRWANIVDIRGYGMASNLATVFPPDLGDLRQVLRHCSVDPIVVSTEGLVVHSSAPQRSQRWTIPTGEAVFQQWFGERKIVATLSDKGKMAARLIAALGGRAGAWWIARPGMLALFEHLSGGTEFHRKRSKTKSRKRQIAEGTRQRSLRAEKLRAELKKVWDGGEVESVLAAMIDANALIIGCELGCPTCGQSSWYPLERLRDRLRCLRCLADFSFPTVQPPPNPWFYRSQGPFAIERHAQGGFMVALVLRFFSLSHSLRLTWVTNLDLKGKAVPLEVDFALWAKSEIGGEPRPALLLGEAKTYGQFEDQDVRRAARLAKRFPGVILVFSTARPKLSVRERQQLVRLARSGRREQFNGKPGWLIMVLTRHELMSESGVPGCWRIGDDRFQRIAQNYTGIRGLLDLCDATQQLHLRMESYDAACLDALSADCGVAGNCIQERPREGAAGLAASRQSCLEASRRPAYAMTKSERSWPMVLLSKAQRRPTSLSSPAASASPVGSAPEAGRLYRAAAIRGHGAER